MKILATLSPKPRKCLKSAFIHQGRGQWPAALQTTTSWCFLPAFYPIKAKEPWKMRGNVGPVNIYSPASALSAPGEGRGKGLCLVTANRPCGFSLFLLEEKGWLRGNSDYLTRILLFVLSPAPPQWSPLQSQWLPGVKTPVQEQMKHIPACCVN